MNEIKTFHFIFIFTSQFKMHFYPQGDIRWRHSAVTVPEDILLQRHQQPQWPHHTA